MKKFTVAIYWDFENVRIPDQTKCLVDLTQSKGHLCIQKAYSHWWREPSCFQSILDHHGFKRIDVLEKGKDSADRKLEFDCLAELYSDTSPDIFIIVSGDGGFASLVRELKSQEKYVIVVGRHVSSHKLIDLADEFYFIESQYGVCYNEEMPIKLPSNTIIASAKLTKYLLVFRPADDKSKFLAQAGYTQENWQQLEVDLREQILPLDAIPSDESNRFGDVYEIWGVLTGINGISLNVVTIWMTEYETGQTKFITLFPNKEVES